MREATCVHAGQAGSLWSADDAQSGAVGLGRPTSGLPTVPHRRYSIEDLPAEIRSRVVVNSLTGCWEWQFIRRSSTPDCFRYGALKWQGVSEPVHRITYKMLVGPIPDDFELDHVYAWGCRSHACCWPAHLEPVTSSENSARGQQANIGKGVARTVQLRIARGLMTDRDLALADAAWMLPLPAPAPPPPVVRVPRPPALCQTDEAAAVLGITVEELIDRRQENREPGCFRIGRNWFYIYATLLEFKQVATHAA